MAEVFWTFVEAEQIADRRIAIEGAAGHHLARVLRVRPGERGVAVHAGREYQVEVLAAHHDRVLLGVVGEGAAGGEPTVHITLLQAALPNPDFDAVIEGATAAGVGRIVAVAAARSIGRPPPARLARWRSIARSAAEQSHRGTIPQVSGPMSLAEALTDTSGRRLLVLHPGSGPSVLEAAAGAARLAVAVGPEGGWTDDELRTMTEVGGIPSSLGPRLLRARLAPVVATAILVQQR